MSPPWKIRCVECGRIAEYGQLMLVANKIAEYVCRGECDQIVNERNKNSRPKKETPNDNHS